jgi:hypothetical protein
VITLELSEYGRNFRVRGDPGDPCQEAVEVGLCHDHAARLHGQPETLAKNAAIRLIRPSIPKPPALDMKDVHHWRSLHVGKTVLSKDFRCGRRQCLVPLHESSIEIEGDGVD